MSENTYPAGHPQLRRHVPPRRGQGLLGLTATLTIVGAILLYYTNATASQCLSTLKSHSGLAACHGLAAAARHVQLPLAVCVIACAVVFGITFAWSLLWA
ncbi:MAG TPA: hypothetical protein VMA32_07805 [Streptosporangiaceae bacterium]|nr:hypothetical protein [Streptosporangiaceae bacterium]